MLQDESLKLLSESSGGATRMGHILLTLPYIRMAAADRKVIQVTPINRIVMTVINFIDFALKCREKRLLEYSLKTAFSRLFFSSPLQELLFKPSVGEVAIEKLLGELIRN